MLELRGAGSKERSGDSGQPDTPEGGRQRGARFSCVGVPTTDVVKLVYNVRHLDFLKTLWLPGERFTGQ